MPCRLLKLSRLLALLTVVALPLAFGGCAVDGEDARQDLDGTSVGQHPDEGDLSYAPPQNGGGGGKCGNNRCEANKGETCDSCPGDCGPCDTCGNGVCDSGETCSDCSIDCGACEPSCGDNACNGLETCSTCATDCGVCPEPTCGDGVCGDGETCESCSADCGACPSGTCGDRVCDKNETCSGCSFDCGMCPQECGNGICEIEEGPTSCPADCTGCGDGICDIVGGETDLTCSVDCGCRAYPYCGGPGELLPAPAGCFCGGACGLNGDCCYDQPICG